MLYVANALFIVVHLCIILFTLFGWIPIQTRKLHFYLVMITAFSWVVLGYWFGFGYCFFTDWHWMVRKKIGISGDPSSFVKLVLDFVSGRDVDTVLVDTLTAVAFALVLLISIYLHVFRRSAASSSNSV